MTPPRLVDPIHLFNARGHSLVTEEFQSKRIAELEAQLEEANRRVRSMAMRLKAIGEEDSKPSAANS